MISVFCFSCTFSPNNIGIGRIKIATSDSTLKMPLPIAITEKLKHLASSCSNSQPAETGWHWNTSSRRKVRAPTTVTARTAEQAITKVRFGKRRR